MFINNRQITIKEVADDVFNWLMLLNFFVCFGYEILVAKFVPKLLNFEHNQRQMIVAQESLNEVNNDAELPKRVITGDKTWVYGYDVKTKAQLPQWRHSKSPRPKNTQ